LYHSFAPWANPDARRFVGHNDVDLTELNLSPVLESPVRNVMPNLVYAGSGHEVVTVMVAGEDGPAGDLLQTALLAVSWSWQWGQA
jgi:hypothetical protein